MKEEEIPKLAWLLKTKVVYKLGEAIQKMKDKSKDLLKVKQSSKSCRSLSKNSKFLEFSKPMK